MRIVASSTIYSSYCSGGSRYTSTSTAAPAVVRKTLVIICATYLWIREIAVTTALPLPLLLPLFPGMCYTK
jgi:hypothetical protein